MHHACWHPPEVIPRQAIEREGVREKEKEKESERERGRKEREFSSKMGEDPRTTTAGHSS